MGREAGEVEGGGGEARRRRAARGGGGEKHGSGELRGRGAAVRAGPLQEGALQAGAARAGGGGGVCYGESLRAGSESVRGEKASVCPARADKVIL